MDEQPLSIRYLWETPSRVSSSSQRGSQEIQGTRDHRRSSSATSTYSISSQTHGSRGSRSSLLGPDSSSVPGLLLENLTRGSGVSSLSNTQTASVRQVGNLTAQRHIMSNDVHLAQYPSSTPQQMHATTADFTRGARDPTGYATTQIQQHSAPYLAVPGVESFPSRQPQMIFTDEQGASYHPNGMSCYGQNDSF